MDAFLQLSTDERREACRIAEGQILLRAASIEKDFWICWALRELFALPCIGEHLTFKGGTSLSKGWKLIERFSEDLDLTVDRAHLGFSGDQSPEVATSNNQRRHRLEALHAACVEYVQNKIQPAMEERIVAQVPGGRIIRDPDDELSLVFEYPTVFPPDAYLRPSVKMEFGARSDIDPSETPEIRPYLIETLPDLTGGAFYVRALSPKRTFWEKAMLIHEETYREEQPKPRLARHYYDLWCLIRGGIADQAVADCDLFDRVADHRRTYFRHGRGQDTIRRGTLRLMPRRVHMATWHRDYDAMRESMFFGDTPEFFQILEPIGEFETRFNAAWRSTASDDANPRS